jgi:hypothetical protein
MHGMMIRIEKASFPLLSGLVAGVPLIPYVVFLAIYSLHPGLLRAMIVMMDLALS